MNNLEFPRDIFSQSLPFNVESEIKKNGIPKKYTSILSDFSTIMQKLTPNIQNRALETILALAILENNAEQLSRIPNESDRNTKISSLTGLAAEPGLISANTPERIKNLINNRADSLLDCYKKEKNSHELERFFSNAFKADPCFNGRMIALEEYAGQYQKEMTEIDAKSVNEALVGHDVEYGMLCYNYTDLMYECNTANDKGGQDEAPSKEEFVTWLKTRPEYEEQYKSTVESPRFQGIFNYAKVLGAW